MKIILPVGPRCLIKPYQSAEKTSSGLILDNTSNVSAAPVKGSVLEIGDKGKFKKGDEVLFRRYSVDDLKIITPEGETSVALVDYEDILAIEKEE